MLGMEGIHAEIDGMLTHFRDGAKTRRRLQSMASLVSRSVDSPHPAYVMFNNLPRVGDAKRFVRMVAG